jgi:hypothetical protein
MDRIRDRKSESLRVRIPNQPGLVRAWNETSAFLRPLREESRKPSLPAFFSNNLIGWEKPHSPIDPLEREAVRLYAKRPHFAFSDLTMARKSAAGHRAAKPQPQGNRCRRVGVSACRPAIDHYPRRLDRFSEVGITNGALSDHVYFPAKQALP